MTEMKQRNNAACVLGGKDKDVRCQYAYVVEPRKYDDGDKYEVTILWKKTDKATSAAVSKAIDDAIELKFPGKKLKSQFKPVRDGQEQFEADPAKYAAYEGCYYINSRTKDAPDVRGRAAKPVVNKNDPEAPVSGDKVKVWLELYGFEFTDEKGNKGQRVNASFYAIQLLEKGPRNFTRQRAKVADDEFESIDVEDEGEDFEYGAENDSGSDDFFS